jgi:hypothetical protein
MSLIFKLSKQVLVTDLKYFFHTRKNYSKASTEIIEGIEETYNDNNNQLIKFDTNYINKNPRCFIIYLY